MSWEFNGETSERKVSFGVQLEQGDLLTIVCTAILPGKTEREEVENKTPIGEDWRNYAHFKDGIMCVFTALKKTSPDGIEETFVDYDTEAGTLHYPVGKFGYQFYHTVNQTGLYGKELSQDFKFDADMEEGKRKKPITYTLHGLPPKWNQAKPLERLDYWLRMASLTLKIGSVAPIVEKKEIYRLNFNTVHPLSVGDITTAYLQKSDYNNKTYNFLKTYVKNPDANAKKKYLTKSGYSIRYFLDEFELSEKLAKRIYDDINKKSSKDDDTDPSKKPYDKALF